MLWMCVRDGVNVWVLAESPGLRQISVLFLLKEKGKLGKFYLFNGSAVCFSFKQGINICLLLFVLGNTTLALILQITWSLQVSLYAVLPGWQNLLWSLFSGHSKFETLVLPHQCMVLLLLEPVTGSSPKPLLVESRDFCGDFLLSLRGKEEITTLFPRTGPTKRDLINIFP